MDAVHTVLFRLLEGKIRVRLKKKKSPPWPPGLERQTRAELPALSLVALQSDMQTTGSAFK